MLPDDVLQDADTRDLLVEAGTRVLHIGPHKTGTTAVQGAFGLARERLAAHGVVYAATVRGVLAVIGRQAMRGEAEPDIAHWDKLVREISGAGNRRVLVSSEFFADGDDEAARRVIEDLGGSGVHVVVTLRSLAKIMPSQWQQYLQNGACTPYLKWLDGMLRKPPYTQPTPSFWRRHRHDKLIARWAAAAGAHNVTVIVVDESDRLMLLRTFESLLGLPGGFLVPDEQAMNRSLTFAEAELVRLLNAEFKRQGWPDSSYARFMRYGAVKRMKTARQPSPDEPGIVTPAWALERAAEIGAEMADNILALGVRVVGDISALGKLPADPPQAEADAGFMKPLIPAEAAARAVAGAFSAGGVAGHTAEVGKRRAADDRPLREVDAKTLARVLAKRGRQRVRKAFQLRAPGRPPAGLSGGMLPCAGQGLVCHRDNQRDADRECECGSNIHAGHVPGR